MRGMGFITCTLITFLKHSKVLIVWIVATPGDKILQLHSFIMQHPVTEMG